MHIQKKNSNSNLVKDRIQGDAICGVCLYDHVSIGTQDIFKF